MQVIDYIEQGKLSKLESALAAIECSEGADYDANSFKSFRTAVVEAVGLHCCTRFRLGRVLAPYRQKFKLEKVWTLARKEIAKMLKCHHDHVTRIIKNSELATELTPFELEALGHNDIDPGEKKNIPIVEKLLVLPRPTTRVHADAAVSHVVDNHRAARKVAKQKPVPGSLVEFAERIVKLCSGFFGKLSPTEKKAGIKYIFELLIAALHVDVPDLTKYSCMRDVPKPLIRKDK